MHSGLNKGLCIRWKVRLFGQRTKALKNVKASTGKIPVVGVGDTNVRVTVNGTTFGAIYEVVGLRLELTSADLGDHSVPIGGEAPQAVAVQLLRTLAQVAMKNREIPFLRDDQI